MFKKGMVEFGECIEEVFVNMGKGFEFEGEVGEWNVLKGEIGDVGSGFEIMKYEKL